MKRIFFFVLFLSIFNLVKADKEMVIIRVEYSKNKTGYHTHLFLDMGTSNTHSLYNVFQNDESGSVTYKDTDGKMKVFTSEVDLMNFLLTLGYSYESQFSTEVIAEKKHNFILVKE